MDFFTASEGMFRRAPLRPFGLFELVDALLNGLDGVAPHGSLDSQGLRIAPEVKSRDLVHAGNRAVVRAGLFGEILPAHVVERVLLQRNPGVTPLLRAVVDQTV